jgi:hypothetical protein
MVGHAQLLAPLRVLPPVTRPAAMRVSVIAPPAARPVAVAPKPPPKPARGKANLATHETTGPDPLPLPPALQWRYRLVLNGREGTALLTWQPEAGRYRLQLDREAGDKPLPGWRSTGRIAAAGLAPDRYAELRKDHDARATNFRRDEGLISYSASSEILPLPEGVQDNLSWWLQLAAQASSGRSVDLAVAGTRGEPLQWHFEWQGTEQGLWHYRREAQEQWDGPLDVWLDPAQHRLPVRMISGDPTARGALLERISPDMP